MARPSRSERRARREAREQSRQAAGNGGAGAMPPVAVASPQPSGGSGPAGHGPARGSFVRESWGELRKVEWPGQSQVIQGVVVVLIAMVVVGTYLYAADNVFRRLVEDLILR